MCYVLHNVFLRLMSEIKTLKIPWCAASKVGVGGDVLCS